jgi:serine/threonine protein kinase
MVRCASIFVSLLWSVFLLGAPGYTQPKVTYPKHHTKTFFTLEQFIQSEQWDEAGRTVRRGLTSGALVKAEIEMLANAYLDTPFAKAFAGAKCILELTEPTGLTLAAVFPITLFAESGLAEEVLKGEHFWTTKRYGRELEYDAEQQTFYIHLGTRGVKPLGAGRKKVITRTIQYDRLHPKVMARGTSEQDMREEMRAMRALRGCPGLIDAEGLMRHKKPDTKKRVMTIITEIFNAGSLQDVMDNHSLKLSLRERISVARDIVTGLASMHGHKFVHRDLGARNYFVNIEKKGVGRRCITAVIADMGRTIPVSRARNVPVQGNKGYMAPEGVFRSKLQRTDYYGTDIFAVGTVLWRLCYGHPAPWQARRYSSDTSRSLKKRYKLLVNSIKNARSGPLGRIRDKIKRHKRLTLGENFAQLVLQMTDPVAKRRGTAHQLKKKFLELQDCS